MDNHFDNHQNNHTNHTAGQPLSEEFKQQEFSRTIAGKTVLVRCDNRLEQQALWLLSTIDKLSETQPLEDGASLEVGWSVLTLVEQNGSIIVCEPDFDNDPFEQAVDDVSRTLWVLLLQNEIIMQTGTEEYMQVPRFDDTIVLKKGVLQEERIYLERSNLTDDDDDNETEGDSGEQDGIDGASGWFIGSVGDDDEEDVADNDDDENFEDFEAIYVYQLIQSRPMLLSVLSLPVGYTVIFDGEEIETIIDHNGVDVWNTDDEPHNN